MIHTGDGSAPVNVRIYSDGRSKDSKQSLISWIVAVVTLTAYTGWMHVLILLSLASLFYPLPRYILAALWATTFLPAKPILWRAFCASWVFKTWRDYFNFSYLNEEIMDSSKTYIFVEFPHGVFPLSELIAGTMMQAIWPNFSVYSVAASSVFSIPFWRHFVAWLGAVPATNSGFKSVLRRGNVACIVGGIAEMYMQHPRKERIKLAGRKGFARIAVEQQLDGGVVPVYHMGNTQVFDFWPQSLERLARKHRAGLGFLVGRWGLPIPRQVPLFMVCGKPIAVPRIDTSDPAAVAEATDAVHAAVVAELQAIYDRHRGTYGWADRPLVIE